jgi:hypothetical protein
MRPSPGLVLAVILVLVVAQVTRLVAPERGHYLWSLGLATAGLLGGELIAATGHVDGVSVGPVHPLLDVVVMGVLEAVGAMLLSRPERTGE